jgi:hypothetical protein
MLVYQRVFHRFWSITIWNIGVWLGKTLDICLVTMDKTLALVCRLRQQRRWERFPYQHKREATQIHLAPEFDLSVSHPRHSSLRIWLEHHDNDGSANGSTDPLHHWAPGVGEAIQLVAAALSQRARWLSGAGLQTWVILKHRLGLNKLMGALAT